jgi:hypothetical protein
MSRDGVSEIMRVDEGCISFGSAGMEGHTNHSHSTCAAFRDHEMKISVMIHGTCCAYSLTSCV